MPRGAEIGRGHAVAQQRAETAADLDQSPRGIAMHSLHPAVLLFGTLDRAVDQVVHRLHRRAADRTCLRFARREAAAARAFSAGHLQVGCYGEQLHVAHPECIERGDNAYTARPPALAVSTIWSSSRASCSRSTRSSTSSVRCRISASLA